MSQKIFLISLLAPFFLTGLSCKSAYQLTPSHIDQQTSQAFMAAAHTLLKYAQNQQDEVGIILSNSDASIVTTAKDISKKKYSLKSLRFKKQKASTATSSSTPSILSQSGTCAPERILDSCMGALSLYTSAYEIQTSSMRIYLKTQISNVMNAVKNVLAPATLDANTTLLEPEYEHIWNNATNILCDPYTLESVLQDIKKRIPHSKKHPNQDTLFMLLHSLHSLNKKCDPYQGAIIRSYAHEILKIIYHTKNKPSNIEHEKILDYWNTIKSTQLDFDDLIQSLQKRVEHSSKLCMTSSAQAKEPFRLKLIEKQINMLKKFLFIHKDCDNTFKRYWIAKEAQKIRQLVRERLLDDKEHPQWNKICGHWHAESDDLCTTLKYIMKCIETVLPTKEHIRSSLEIHKEHIMAFGFTALPVLVDIYQRYALPPALLQKVTVPMRTILDSLLFFSKQCELMLTAEQETIVEKAHIMTCILTRTYSAKYHCILGDQHRTLKHYAQAKKHFVIAARDLLNAQQQKQTYAADFLESGDHLYISLVQMLEKKIPFCQEDLKTVIKLADQIDVIPTHPKLLLSQEVMKLSTFLEQLNKKGLLDTPQQQASCSSNNQK